MKSITSRNVIALLAVAAVATILAACNTVEGAGRDIKAGGKALENAASDSK
ncbi:MAG TPA: entericidin A/B family lipoprotein [Phycisphaerales bacterium]|nr:entericidin A/B family lipoprotein [Phycisphaerales bacterium]